MPLGDVLVGVLYWGERQRERGDTGRERGRGQTQLASGNRPIDHRESSTRSVGIIQVNIWLHWTRMFFEILVSQLRHYRFQPNKIEKCVKKWDFGAKIETLPNKEIKSP